MHLNDYQWLLFLTACASESVTEIKTKENIGKEVAIKGEVLKSFKVGSISGYILIDKYNETIGVSTQTLPKEGTTVTVEGILMIID